MKAIKVLSILTGWLWTISCVLITIPLFSIPVAHSFDTLVTHSLFVGPFMKSIKLF
jgi:hypothetical protein